MDPTSLDRAVAEDSRPRRFRDRITGEEVELSEADFEDLCRIHLYDWHEQVGRSRYWEYRRDGYRRLAERLGERARQDYARVFALEEEHAR